MAKKINGRMLAVDYRLAPQYPFPCALQDLLAAYIFLIRPPPGAAHRPVHPSLIVVGGDSAGGGLTLALLQVIRDSGLPLPAGGTLISPWCDLASSFPSIHSNVKTDVIPMWGLSLQKPSTLWPPPPPEIQEKVHQSLRTRIRELVQHDGPGVPHDVIQEPLNQQQDHNEALHKRKLSSPEKEVKKDSDTGKIDMGPTEKLPKWDDPTGDQSIVIATKDGKELTVEDQVQLYTQNSLLLHPLVSPALGFLGGLPPLQFIIGNAEVLRDEGIYTAHKAAYPEKFPIDPEAKDMYPPLQDPELLKKYGPTPIHLQVYDDCAHDMPMLFAFTTPAKYCFRAMAQFMKHVSGRNDVPSLFSASSTQSFASSGLLASPRSETSSDLDKPLPERPGSRSSESEESYFTGRSESPDLETEPSTPKKPNGALPPLDTDTDHTPRKESLGQKITSALYTNSPASASMASSRTSTVSSQDTVTNEVPTPKATKKASQPQANGNGSASPGIPNDAKLSNDSSNASNGDANPMFTTEPKPMETLHEDDEHDPSHTPRRQTVSNAGLSLKTGASTPRGASPPSTTRTRPRRGSEVSTSQASSSRSRKFSVKHRMSSLFLGRNRAQSVDSEDVAGPRFGPSTSRSSSDSQRYGGDPAVYQESPVCF
jgi:acetyl esterase/lipase